MLSSTYVAWVMTLYIITISQIGKERLGKKETLLSVAKLVYGSREFWKEGFLVSKLNAFKLFTAKIDRM